RPTTCSPGTSRSSRLVRPGSNRPPSTRPPSITPMPVNCSSYRSSRASNEHECSTTSPATCPRSPSPRRSRPPAPRPASAPTPPDVPGLLGESDPAGGRADASPRLPGPPPERARARLRKVEQDGGVDVPGAVVLAHRGLYDPGDDDLPARVLVSFHRDA